MPVKPSYEELEQQVQELETRLEDLDRKENVLEEVKNYYSPFSSRAEMAS